MFVCFNPDDLPNGMTEQKKRCNDR